MREEAVNVSLYVGASSPCEISILGPGWCGSVDWVPACEPKGCQFDSQSGHTPGLQARSPVGAM